MTTEALSSGFESAEGGPDMYKDLGKHAVQRQRVLGENAERHYPKKRNAGSVFSSHGSSLIFNPTCITIAELGLLHSAIKNSLHTGSHVQFPYREVVPRHSGERHTSCPFSTARPAVNILKFENGRKGWGEGRVSVSVLLSAFWSQALPKRQGLRS